MYRARMLGPGGFEKIVCLKRILPEQSRNPGFEAMFMDEARVAAALHHANIVQVFDFYRDDEERLTIVMEYVDGASLKRLLTWQAEQGGPAEPAIAAAIARSILEGLNHAWHGLHDGVPLRVIHRDLSPHNILLSLAGEVKLADFGIAKALITTVRTRAGVVKGKASYMSPEQAMAGRLDCRSDLYSAGVVLWEMLAGRRLFPSGGHDGRCEAPAWDRVAPPLVEAMPSVPPGLSRLVDSLLENDRNRRPADPAAALDLLEGCGVTPASSMALARLVTAAAGRATARRGEEHGARTVPDRGTTASPTEEDGKSGQAATAATSASPPLPLDSGDILTERAIITGGASPGREGLPDKAGARAPRSASRGVIAATAVAAALTLPLAASLVVLWASGLPGSHRAAHEAGVAAQEASGRAPAADGAWGNTPTPAPAAAAASSLADPGARIADESAGAGQAIKAAGSSGTIDVNAKPWAEVYLDGRRMGSTPLRLSGVPAGKHLVRLVNESTGVEKMIVVKVGSGKNAKVTADLSAE